MEKINLCFTISYYRSKNDIINTSSVHALIQLVRLISCGAI